MADQNQNKTVAQLRAEAKAKGLHGYSTMRKAELIVALAQDDGTPAPATGPASPAAKTPAAKTLDPATPTPAITPPPAQAELTAPPVQSELTAAPTPAALTPAPQKAASSGSSTPVPRVDAVAEADASRAAASRTDASRDRFTQLLRTSPTDLPGDRVTPGMIAAIAAVVAILVILLRRRRCR
ncbi:hypothetical protein GOHSU_23_00140 [Gordonia hirsuta DSM 44140 = NBRC 16056]|uniref:Rho termination factor-like N-terminal domain-containing protein n=1 Tax=Gordonia hirsuta DSM 44140 = NBRC 16056 TaxID=1121927 RepID=L7LCA5_9ACTN|nr:Rho termination factor N-terminal domain-containing protein [Gordonia hirsuta]GAC57668.1 hypothetical protein GOHSU_23_00140 [Gordonia hirsuta DSM 44140 = NBRC 16056]